MSLLVLQKLGFKLVLKASSSSAINGIESTIWALIIHLDIQGDLCNTQFLGWLPYFLIDRGADWVNRNEGRRKHPAFCAVQYFPQILCIQYFSLISCITIFPNNIVLYNVSHQYCVVQCFPPILTHFLEAFIVFEVSSSRMITSMKTYHTLPNLT